MCIAEELHRHLIFRREALRQLAVPLAFFEIVDKRDGVAADCFFLGEVAEVYHDWHSADGAAKLVVLGLADAPSGAAAMKTTKEQQVIQVRPNHTHFL